MCCQEGKSEWHQLMKAIICYRQRARNEGQKEKKIMPGVSGQKGGEERASLMNLSPALGS
jgi:hypothetical protein